VALQLTQGQLSSAMVMLVLVVMLLSGMRSRACSGTVLLRLWTRCLLTGLLPWLFHLARCSRLVHLRRLPRRLTETLRFSRSCCRVLLRYGGVILLRHMLFSSIGPVYRRAVLLHACCTALRVRHVGARWIVRRRVTLRSLALRRGHAALRHAIEVRHAHRRMRCAGGIGTGGTRVAGNSACALLTGNASLCRVRTEVRRGGRTALTDAIWTSIGHRANRAGTRAIHRGVADVPVVVDVIDGTVVIVVGNVAIDHRG